MKFLVIDDHPFIRMGVKELLSAKFKDSSVIEAGGYKEALESLSKDACDFVILDINLNGKTGFNVIEELNKHINNVPVIILSMHMEKDYITKSFNMGAKGYVTKNAVMKELIRAVETVREGGTYISSDLVKDMIIEPHDGEKPLYEDLSPREKEIMMKIVSGRKLKEIANDLSLSMSSVNTYRSRILKKLNINGIPELVRYAVKYKLIKA